MFLGGSSLNPDHIQRCQMIRPKKGKGVFQSFLVSGFSMMFFSYGHAKCVIIHLQRAHMEDRELLHFYSLKVVQLPFNL